MFVIVHKDKAMRWTNEFHEDFIQFMPKYLKCKPGEFNVYFMTEEQAEAFSGLSEHDLMAKIKDIAECDNWPYDENKKFLGNRLK